MGGPSDWIFLTIAGASCLTCAFAFKLWRSGQALLPKDPRREVPWRAYHLVGVILLVLTLNRLATWLLGIDADTLISELSPDKAINMMGAIGMTNLVACGGGVLLVHLTSGATARDLGLPESLRVVWQDVRLGWLTFLTVIIPVYGIQWLLVQWQLVTQQMPVEHPLIDTLRRQLDIRTAIVGMFVAVLAAPIFEEFFFRLLLQGWLEKIEGLWFAERHDENHEDAARNDQPAEPKLTPVWPDLATRSSLAPAKSEMKGQTYDHDSQPLPETWTGRCPRGIIPIFLSSSLFAFVHLEYWPDPIPLFFLALALGYIYQRTHRLLPSIFVHALFNGFSLGIFWLAESTEGSGM